MADLFQVTGSDTAPNDADGGAPSIPAIVAAFRKAAGGRARREVSGEATSAELVLPAPSRSTLSPAEVIEETIAAFRKAERRAAGRSKKSWATSPGPGASAELAGADSPADEAPHARSRSGDCGTDADRSEASSSEGSSGPVEREDTQERADEGETDSPEDLALAFRRALSRREYASGGDSPVEGEQRESEELDEKSSEVEPRSSPQHDPPRINPSSFPPRPDPSFLWVTDAFSDEPAAVSVEALAEPRAREAKAFLLGGEGDRPYQLLKRIRGHPETSVYLKPVFWRRADGERSPVTEHVDGTWTRGAGEETLAALREQAASINQRVRVLSETAGTERETTELRVLRFVATRSAEFAPHRVAEDEERVVYPKLTPLLEQSSQNGDWCGRELADILSTTARRLREKRSSGS